MIDFNGKFIYGTHESPVYQAPALQAVRTHFAGVLGESEIRLGRKGRSIYIPILLHNGYSQAGALNSALEALDRLVGDHGQLRITHGPWGGVPRIYKHCTFEGFAKDPTPFGGPLADLVGTLDGSSPSWWVRGVLQWQQLSVEG